MNRQLSKEELDSIALARESILQQAREKTAKSKKKIAAAKKELEEKEESKATEPAETNEPEIVAVISMSDYENAGGEISKILNNTPENLFDEEAGEEDPVLEQGEIEEFEKIEIEEVIEPIVKPKLRKFGRIVSIGDDEMEKRKTILKEIEKEKSDEYATSILEECPKTVFARLMELSTGEYFIISKAIFTIGISKKCDLVIKQSEKDHTVSRNHASIIIKNDTTYIRDTSSNGTFVGSSEDNFFRLPKGNAVELKDGQYIKFADLVYKFEKGGEGFE